MQESLSKTSSKRAVDLEFVDEEDLILRENTWVSRHQIHVLIVQSCYTQSNEEEKRLRPVGSTSLQSNCWTH